MIPKKHRFHGLGALSHVYRRGVRASTGDLSLRVYRSRREDYRLAVVISKKIHKSAVVRNRIRRRIFEAMRVVRAEQKELWPYDIILSVFDEKLADIPAKDLRKSLINLLQKTKIIKTG